MTPERSNLATKSGLTWDTIRRRSHEVRLERDDNWRPCYMHAADCPGDCECICNGEVGEKIADDVANFEELQHDDQPDSRGGALANAAGLHNSQQHLGRASV